MYSTQIRRSFSFFILNLLVLSLLAGCQPKNSTPDSPNGESASKEAEKADDSARADDSAKKESAGEKKGNIPGPNIYPGMNLGALSPTQRVKFVDIAQAEVCPCPDAAESLHECMQKESAQCDMAQQVAVQIAQGVQQGFSQTDILDGVAKFIENSKKVHEFDLKGVPFKGTEDAKVTIVEFADFECPYCRVASKMLDDLGKKYTGSVAIYFKQFPLDGHQHSMSAATAALAAHNQGKFWEMHDLLFDNQRALGADAYKKFAGRIGLNTSKFESDQKKPAIVGAIQRDRQEGEKAGLTGTPTIYINGRKYMGPIDEKALSRAIESSLNEGGSNDKAADKKADEAEEK